MLELYFFSLLSFAFIVLMSSIATGKHPTVLPKVYVLSSLHRAYKSEQLIKEKLSAKEKDLLIFLFLFCQFLLLC